MRTVPTCLVRKADERELKRAAAFPLRCRAPRQPPDHTMFGGLLVSQALTLFTTPVVYLYLDRVNDHLGHWLGRRRAQAPEHIIVAGE